MSAAPQPTNSPTPSASIAAPAVEAIELGEIVATIKGESLDLYTEPGGTPTQTLDQWSDATFAPLTLLGLERSADGSWIKVLLPAQPNQSTAWIQADQVEVHSTDVRIDIYLESNELELSAGGQRILTAPVALGAPESPTPVGLYSITDPLDSTHNTTGVYGAYALGLSGFSEVLTEFNGAPPQLAIHGTNQPELIGQNISNGCIRLTNEHVMTVVEHAALGTPVVIHQSRNNLTAPLS